jgi:type IV secretion system protein VirB4
MANGDRSCRLPMASIWGTTFLMPAYPLASTRSKRGGRAGDFSAILSLKEYPDTTRAGMLDNLLRLPHEMVLSESFAPADRQGARERIDLAVRRLKSADAEAMAERAQMMAARDALGAGQAGFGDHHLTVLVREDSLFALERASASVASAMADIGIIAVREDTNWNRPSGRSFPAMKPMRCAAR